MLSFLRNQRDFVISTVNSVNYASESIRLLGPKIWESLSKNLKKKKSVQSFKMAIKDHALVLSVKYIGRT